MEAPLTLDFSEIGMKDVARVGGKNASLGELYAAFHDKEIGVLDGFAVTTDAYWLFLRENQLEQRLAEALAPLDVEDIEQLAEVGRSVRQMILGNPMPQELESAIVNEYHSLSRRLGREPDLAVRSSASAEDLPEASFAGAAESFLNVRGTKSLLQAVHQCFASLFTDRAISYRARLGYSHLKVALSVGVMPMVHADRACSGVMFTLDTESGFRNVITLTGSYGLGEFVVQGVVTPDEWTIFKPTLTTRSGAILGRRMGSKEVRLIYGDGTRTTRSEATPIPEREKFCLEDEEVLQLARWGCMIEQHYSQIAGHGQPMDIEWAKDGTTQKLYIVQARPETVHSGITQRHSTEVFRLKAEPGVALLSGQAVGERIGAGKARVVKSLTQLNHVQPGEVLVAANTDPDWEPVMRRVAGIVTDQGGRTAHAAIVSREFGIPCIVGTGDATRLLKSGQEITVCCTEGSEGHVYSGILPFEVERHTMAKLPQMLTKVMLIVGDPSRAFNLAALPNDGVGLVRIEFIITNQIGIHPMALAQIDAIEDPEVRAAIQRRIGGEEPKAFFIRRLSEGVGRIAAAFYPKPVIVRLSDFKTNEYANLLGGAQFEPREENPMIGFRGASRYYDPRYAAGFALECEALKKVREEFGLTNVRIMVPFCRTVVEGRKVIDMMAQHGLKQHSNGLEIYAMCEIPANAVLAEDFLEIFDGYSIGSNDLTQLTLGLDRDSATVAKLFDERNDAVRWMIAHTIQAAHRLAKPVGICGQAPSDFPEFAEWLVQQGIDSISLNPDTVITTAERIARAEESRACIRAEKKELARAQF